ncbi:MAG: SDR family oxidoreductase [Pseudomonadota bacterium]
MKSKILVTGGAGYIGAVLVPKLLEEGHNVAVLDSFARGEAHLAACCQYDGFEPVRGDARDERVVKGLAAKADIVIPLAALVGAPLCARDPIGAETINRDAVLMLLKHIGRDQRLVFPNSNSGYGIGQGDNFCTEDSPLNPISLYGQTKVEAEKAILDSGKGISLRLATVFGLSPRMRLDLLVNDFTYRAVNDRFVVVFEGHFKRNYIHVRDVVAAFVHAIGNFEAMRGMAFNVGLSDANFSKLELCALIQRYVPDFVFLEAPIGEDPDKRNYIVSNARIEGTGFKPAWSLDRGVRELLRGYRMLNNARFSNV